MGLHAQAYAAMPLPPALAEVINDLLDDERCEEVGLRAQNGCSAAWSAEAATDSDAPATASPQTQA